MSNILSIDAINKALEQQIKNNITNIVEAEIEAAKERIQAQLMKVVQEATIQTMQYFTASLDERRLIVEIVTKRGGQS